MPRDEVSAQSASRWWLIVDSAGRPTINGTSAYDPGTHEDPSLRVVEVIPEAEVYEAIEAERERILMLIEVAAQRVSGTALKDYAQAYRGLAKAIRAASEDVPDV